MKNIHTYSVVVETENLGMAELGDLESSLDSIKQQTYKIEKLQEVLLIVGGHLSKEILTQLAEKYPWVSVHMEKNALDYARSKMKGAEVAKGSVVIFADSDMRYEKTWLASMVKAIEENPAKTIISGDTRLETVSSYSFALNCTWMIQVLNDKINKPVPILFFPLNNFAVERELMLKIPVPYTLPLYRNKIPLWQSQLIKNGVKILRAPGTRGYHAPPGNFMDWWYRMLAYGADFVAQASFVVGDNVEIIEAPNYLRRIAKLIFLVPWKVEQLFFNSYKLLKEDFSRIKYLPLAYLIGFTNCMVMGIGGLIACFNRDLIFHKVSSREAAHVV